MRANYVIVGGGIYGAATACALARRGAGVLLLEATALAAGASGGLGQRGIRANGRDVRELPLMRVAYDLWPSLEADLGAPTGFTRVGHLQLYERYHDVGGAAIRARVQQAAGIPTEHLEGDRVREHEPGLGTHVLGGLYAAHDAVCDHEATVQAYARAAERAGGTVRVGARVTDVVRDGDTVRAVRLADGEEITVERGLLLLANGGIVDLCAQAFDCALPVWNIYPQVVCSTPAAGTPFRGLIGHASRPIAMKVLHEGTVMLSGGWRGRRNPDTGQGETVPAYVTGNWAEAVRLFPALASCEVAMDTAARTETASLDLIPVIDRVPGIANAWVAAGWAGHGWAPAPAVAPLLADWALDGSVPDLLRPFGLARFPGLG